MPKKYTMFWNWIRWQCLNKADWHWGEIPKGTEIDHDQFIMEVLKIHREILDRRNNAKTNCQDILHNGL